jgi:hypothetical protein
MSDPMIQVDRRTALRWTASVAAALSGSAAFGALAAIPPEAKGYGLDPNLIEPTVPWPRICTPVQRRAIAFICDYILPASDDAPAATAVGLHEFIDEWVSAPYPQQVGDRTLIFAGLTKLDESARAAGAPSFVESNVTIREAVLDALAKGSDPKFFGRIRALVIGGYYTTEAGFKDIGYIGNQALESYPGPSQAVREAIDAACVKLGLPTTI